MSCKAPSDAGYEYGDGDEKHRCQCSADDVGKQETVVGRSSFVAAIGGAWHDVAGM